jgi:hypothetical protein
MMMMMMMMMVVMMVLGMTLVHLGFLLQLLVCHTRKAVIAAVMRLGQM